MAQYIPFTADDGSTILVEVAEEETYQAGVVKAALEEKVQEAVGQTQAVFEDALDVVRRVAGAFIKKVRSLGDPPDEVEVTFGLKATGEFGTFAVAKAGAEANYTVKLTWKREKKGRSDKGTG